MREVRLIEVHDVDSQMCLVQLKERFSELDIQNPEIISIQRQWNDKPLKINLGLGREDGNVTLFVFYWHEK
jgi:hypothetical protein